MKHKKVSKKSVNSTTGKTSDQVSVNFDGHVSRKMKHSDELNSRSSSRSSRSRSNSQSMSNDSNDESSKSEEETSFNQSMYECGKEKEELVDDEPRVDQENKDIKKNDQMAFGSNAFDQTQVNFGHLFQSQQLKWLSQFYQEMRNGNSSFANAVNSNFLNQIGISMANKATNSGK